MSESYEEVVREARADARELVHTHTEGARADLVLDDPANLNALSAPLCVQLRAAVEAVAADPAVRVAVITGEDPAFCAGGDLSLMADHAPSQIAGPGGTPELWRWIRGEFGGIVRAIVRSDTAFVAAVNGAAAGVGLAIALACDQIVASERARLVPAFSRIGLIPEVGTSWALTRRLGYQGAFELFASGRHLSGAEAAELGLVNACVPHDELATEARTRADTLEALPPHVLRMTKTLLRQAADMTWDQAIATEEFAEPNCFTTAAHAEGLAALRSP